MRVKSKRRRAINSATDRRLKANRVPKPSVEAPPEPVLAAPVSAPTGGKRPPKKRDAEWAAAMTLADAVAEYVENGFPLRRLTGDDHGKPDPYWVDRIAEALAVLGYEDAAAKMRSDVK